MKPFIIAAVAATAAALGGAGMYFDAAPSAAHSVAHVSRDAMSYGSKPGMYFDARLAAYSRGEGWTVRTRIIVGD